jgi:hypothetical protein
MSVVHRNIIIATILVGIGIFFVLSFLFLENKNIPLSNGGGGTTDPYTVNIVEESFQDSLHTLSGVVLAPTPCHQVTVSDVLIAESYPEQVQISLEVASGNDICAQVITEKPFNVTFTASKEATITFLVNSQVVRPEYISNETPIILNNSSLGGKNNLPAAVQ